MDVATPHPNVTVFDDADSDFEKEVEKIQRTAEMQLASVKGLNMSLVKKIRSAEGQAQILFADNKRLTDTNIDFSKKLAAARDEIRTLSIEAASLVTIQEQLKEEKKTVIAKELEVKTLQSERDELESKKDAIQSELDTLETRLNTISLQLEEEREAHQNEKHALDSEVGQRSLDLSNVSAERDATAKEMETLSQTLEKKEQERLHIFDSYTLLEHKSKARTAELEEEIATLTEQKEIAVTEYEKASADLDSLRAEHQAALEAKKTLDADLALLLAEKDTFSSKLDDYEKEIDQKKADIVLLEEDRDQLKKKIELKTNEIAEVNSEVSSMHTEKEYLVLTRDQLETDLEKKNKEYEDKDSQLAELLVSFALLESSLKDTKEDHDQVLLQLEEKKKAFNVLEGEKNLLEGTNSELQTDYDHARSFEKRVKELEEDKKSHLQTITNIQADKQTLIEEHRKEMNALNEKNKQHNAMVTAKLRQKLADVVDNYAKYGKPDEGNSSTHETRDLVIGGDTSYDDDAIDAAAALEVPVVLPEDPTVDYEHDEEKPKADGDTMVMVREDDDDEDDDDDDEDEDEEDDDEDEDEDEDEDDNDEVDDRSPGEGNTAAIVLEEVVEEMVVDEVRSDDVLEEVDEEVPVPAAEAADARMALGGVKSAGEDLVDGTGAAATGVAAAATGAAAGAAASVGSVGEKGMDVAVDAGNKTKEVGEGVKNVTTGLATGAVTGVKDATKVGVDKTKGVADSTVKKSGGLLQKVLCCTPKASHEA